LNRRKRWNCFALAVILLLQTCCGEWMPQSERNIAAEFGMNVKRAYASDQLPADKSRKTVKGIENISENIVENITENTAGIENTDFTGDDSTDKTNGMD